jgi:oxygen-independent coproporphyrinogen-3 oxidase
VPLALYVHVPWCVRKCPYCDFNSHHLRGELPAAEYVDALLADLDQDLASIGGTPAAPLVSIFVGGGTPSLLPAAQVGRLLEGIARRVPIAADAEITLEANPGTVERPTFADLRAAGVTRVSLGIQSLDEAALAALGRIHGRDEALRAAREAIATFERVNLDLMYRLPGQDLAGCLADLRGVLALGAGHLSHYELTLEPSTVFARYPPPGLAGEDAAADMREASEAVLEAAGFRAYEVSAWALSPAHRSRHNLNYWHFGDYLGIGAGAHGKWTDGDGRVMRTAKVRSPRTYLETAQGEGRVAARGAVPEDALPGEFMLNALRLVDGFDDALLVARTGPQAARTRATLAELATEGLMERRGQRWRPTARGRRFLDDLQARFLS